MPEQLPIQPVDKPIICNPYEEPNDHWLYDKNTGEASHGGHRRPAGYWYKTEKVGSAQARLFTEEERDDLQMVNRYGWRGFMKFQMFRPEYIEVHETSGSTD